MTVATFFSAAQLERGRVTPLFSRAVGIDSRASEPNQARDASVARQFVSTLEAGLAGADMEDS
jgi:hypothetical protein